MAKKNKVENVLAQGRWARGIGTGQESRTGK